MNHKTRPAHCRPGGMTDARELGERLRLSRERLSASELAKIGRAWRLWAACVDATFGYAREADQVYATTLGKAAGVDRWAASDVRSFVPESRRPASLERWPLWCLRGDDDLIVHRRPTARPVSNPPDRQSRR